MNDKTWVTASLRYRSNFKEVCVASIFVRVFDNIDFRLFIEGQRKKLNEEKYKNENNRKREKLKINVSQKSEERFIFCTFLMKINYFEKS